MGWQQHTEHKPPSHTQPRHGGKPCAIGQGGRGWGDGSPLAKGMPIMCGCGSPTFITHTPSPHSPPHPLGCARPSDGSLGGLGVDTTGMHRSNPRPPLLADSRDACGETLPPGGAEGLTVVVVRLQELVLQGVHRLVVPLLQVLPPHVELLLQRFQLLLGAC